MRTRLANLLILLFVYQITHAQIPICGSPVPSLNSKSQYDIQPKNGTKKQIKRVDGSNSNSKFVYEVQFHFFISERGERLIDEDQFNIALNNLNAAFYGADVQFVEASKHKHIYEKDLKVFNKSDELYVHQKYHKKNVINVYCFEDIFIGYMPQTKGTEFVGYTYHPDLATIKEYQKDMIIMTYSGITEQTSLIHEFGHFFGLYHTHEYHDDPDRMEYVSGFECHKRGDLICDTDADPNLLGRVDATNPNNCRCDLTDMVDPMGDSYAPLLDNFMSYSPPICRSSFTRGQLNQMNKYALLQRNYLKYRIRPSDQWMAKGTGGTQVRSDVTHDLKNAYAFSELEARSKALIVVWNPESKWSARQYNELVGHGFHHYFTGDNSSYFLVAFSTEELQEDQEFVDFMGNTVFRPPLDEDPDYQLLRRNLSDEIGPAPGLYIIYFRPYESTAYRLAYAFEGYKKPRELKELLDEYHRLYPSKVPYTYSKF
ncbi:MAG: M43 family zinc metalloprotease [Bacteroidota bacterium]